MADTADTGEQDHLPMGRGRACGQKRVSQAAQAFPQAHLGLTRPEV